ncbi:unnamed protein product [Caenorhabditis brenneri]
MSLSRHPRFPLLKLPWLCIKCVLHNSDELVSICLATISNRTRRIVKSSNHPLKEIIVYPSRYKHIIICDKLEDTKNTKIWHFTRDVKFVLQRNSLPFRTSRCFNSWRGHHLQSYTSGDTLDALKIGITFLIDVFGCTIRKVFADGKKLSELFGLGITSVKRLFL